MKLLSRDAERLIFAITGGDLRSIRNVIEFGGDLQRPTPEISRNSSKKLSDEVRSDFSKWMTEERLGSRAFLLEVFQSKDNPRLKRDRTRKSLYGLTLTHAEVERLLQGFNDLKMAHWEAAGSPDWQAEPEKAALSPIFLKSYVIAESVNQIQMVLLLALDD